MYMQILWYSQFWTGLGKEKNLVKNPKFALKCSPDMSGLRDGGVLRCSKELWLFLNLDFSTLDFMTLDFEYLKTPLEYNIDFIFYFRFESINSPSFPALWESVETTLHQLTKNTPTPRKSGTAHGRLRDFVYEHTKNTPSPPPKTGTAYGGLRDFGSELTQNDLPPQKLELFMEDLVWDWACQKYPSRIWWTGPFGSETLQWGAFLY